MVVDVGTEDVAVIEAVEAVAVVSPHPTLHLLDEAVGDYTLHVLFQGFMLV